MKANFSGVVIRVTYREVAITNSMMPGRPFFLLKSIVFDALSVVVVVIAPASLSQATDPRPRANDNRGQMGTSQATQDENNKSYKTTNPTWRFLREIDWSLLFPLFPKLH